MLTWIDGLIVGVFVLYAVAAGLRSRRVASQGLEEYFLAGRSLSGWRAGSARRVGAGRTASYEPMVCARAVASFSLRW